MLAVGCGAKTQNTQNTPSNPSPSPAAQSPTPAPPSTEQVGVPASAGKLSEPISGALQRVTKKPFGIYITPATSPVQPEKFMGYHTGVDFETFSAEQAADVPVFAACDGKLLQKRSATGYGGVMVQACKLDGQDVTIIYGHIRLASVTVKVGDNLKSGQTIAVLGTGYSAETDGERKHLHFGIHKGTAISILGYVQKQADLSQWLDAMQYLK